MLAFLAAGWLVKCLGIFAMTFIHEDVAIVMGAMLIVEYGVPPLVAGGSLYLGVVGGDLMLYALGASARYLPGARRLLISPPIERLRNSLQDHLVVSVALCRVLPGVLFPTYIACGWFRLSFRRFAATSLVTAAVYTPVMLWLAVTFNQTFLGKLGYIGWGLMLVLVLLIAIPCRRLKCRTFKKIVADPPRLGGHSLFGRRKLKAPAITHEGMPPLMRLQRWIAHAERVPNLMFYVPFVLHWFYLGLRYRGFGVPTAANPMIEAGGLWGESKSGCMNFIFDGQRRWLAPFTTVHRREGLETVDADLECALERMRTLGLEFPVVAKPDIGWQGYGVRLVADRDALRHYIASFPSDATFLIQHYVPYDGEAAVYYIRYPGEPTGRLLSLTLRYFPHVIGDGCSTLSELIDGNPRTRWKGDVHLGENRFHLGHGTQDPARVPEEGEVVRLSLIGSIRVGGLYRDASSYITPAMTARFHSIASSMPEFYVGRFDVRFESMEQLQNGDGFRIIETNGAGAEAIQLWDPEKSLGQAYRDLIHAQTLLFKIGAMNRARGFKPMSTREMLAMAWKQHCLIVKYPPSG